MALIFLVPNSYDNDRAVAPWAFDVNAGHVRFCILFKCYFSWSSGTLEVLAILKKLLSKSIMVPSLMEVNIMYELNDFE